MRFGLGVTEIFNNIAWVLGVTGFLFIVKPGLSLFIIKECRNWSCTIYNSSVNIDFV